MDNKIKQFLKRNLTLIDIGEISFVLHNGMLELSNDEYEELISALDQIGIDTTDIRWDLLETEIQTSIQLELQHPIPTDRSNSWSRLSYMLQRLRGQYGFSYTEIVRHLKEHGSRIGVNLKPLDKKYAWMDYPEFDLGYFRKEFYEAQ